MIKKILCFIIILGALLMYGGIVSAEALENPLKVDSFGELIKAISGIVLKVGSALTVLMIIWSGFLFVSARGSEDQVKKARDTFKWTVIGAAVLLGAAVIAEAVVNFTQSLK